MIFPPQGVLKFIINPLQGVSLLITNRLLGVIGWLCQTSVQRGLGRSDGQLWPQLQLVHQLELQLH